MLLLETVLGLPAYCKTNPYNRTSHIHSSSREVSVSKFIVPTVKSADVNTTPRSTPACQGAGSMSETSVHSAVMIHIKSDK